MNSSVVVGGAVICVAEGLIWEEQVTSLDLVQPGDLLVSCIAT